jgi:phosphate acetyltransferase
VSGRSSFGVWGLRHKSNPTEQLAEIAISSADSSMALASSLKLQCYPIPLVPERGDEVDKVRKATQIVREKRPDLK